MTTVEGTITSATGVAGATQGAPLQTIVEFESISAPTVVDARVTSRTLARRSTDADGYFTIGLEAGDYYVRWTNGTVTTQVIISVPESDITYAFHTLISGSLAYTFAVLPQYVLAAPPNGGFRIKGGTEFQIWNPTISKWHTLLAIGADPLASQVALGPGEDP